MKVRYKVNHTDEHGMFFPAGCVAEHAQSDAEKRIDLGVADAVDGDAYSRRLPPDAPVQFECVPETQAVEPTAQKDTKKKP